MHVVEPRPHTEVPDPPRVPERTHPNAGEGAAFRQDVAIDVSDRGKPRAALSGQADISPLPTPGVSRVAIEAQPDHPASENPFILRGAFCLEGQANAHPISWRCSDEKPPARR